MSSLAVLATHHGTNRFLSHMLYTHQSPNLVTRIIEQVFSIFHYVNESLMDKILQQC